MGCTAMSIVFDEMACSMVSLLQITLSNSTISLVEFVGRESYARLTLARTLRHCPRERREVTDPNL
jgi:hypothetical protein